VELLAWDVTGRGCLEKVSKLWIWYNCGEWWLSRKEDVKEEEEGSVGER
jgi:hypothetical protein